jgi:hypothetical protein
MVSAAAAILFGADPSLRPEQVAALLKQTARPIADPLHQAGAGVLDIGEALERVEKGSIPMRITASRTIELLRRGRDPRHA